MKNISLKGHRGFKFRINVEDEILASPRKYGRNVNYISKASWNELIQCCWTFVIDKIMNKLEKVYKGTNQIQNNFLEIAQLVSISDENAAQHT